MLDFRRESAMLAAGCWRQVENANRPVGRRPERLDFVFQKALIMNSRRHYFVYQ
jgi:hypothetical protein